MTLTELESQVFEAAFESAVCGIPFVRRRMPVSISLRVPLMVGGFVESSTMKRPGQRLLR